MAEITAEMIKFNVQSVKLLAMRVILLTLIGCAIAQSLSAQWSAGAHYNYHQTLSVTSGNMGTAPQGMSMLALYRPEASAWSIGVEIGSSGYNPQRFGRTTMTPEFGLVNTDLSELDVMTHAHLIARYHFVNDAAFEPYAEGRAGVMTFATSRKVGTGVSVETGEEVLSRGDMREYFSCADYHSTAFQAGVGLGTIVNLKHLICPTLEEYGFEIKLDFGATYHMGTNAVYGGVPSETNPGLHSSPISQIVYRMGVIVVIR